MSDQIGFGDGLSHTPIFNVRCRVQSQFQRFRSEPGFCESGQDAFHGGHAGIVKQGCRDFPFGCGLKFSFGPLQSDG